VAVGHVLHDLAPRPAARAVGSIEQARREGVEGGAQLARDGRDLVDPGRDLGGVHDGGTLEGSDREAAVEHLA